MAGNRHSPGWLVEAVANDWPAVIRPPAPERGGSGSAESARPSSRTPEAQRNMARLRLERENPAPPADPGVAAAALEALQAEQQAIARAKAEREDTARAERRAARRASLGPTEPQTT